jgi:hypothetical protein
MKYKMVKNIYDIQKLDFKNTLKLTKKVDDICKLDCKINYKMLDLKNKKYIIALLNENNRVIPIKEIINNDKKLKISNFNYYGNVPKNTDNAHLYTLFLNNNVPKNSNIVFNQNIYFILLK